MHTYARTCMHRAEVRGQPAGLALSLQHVGPASWTQTVRQAPLSTKASLQSPDFSVCIICVLLTMMNTIICAPFTVMNTAALHRRAYTFPVLSPFGLSQAILSWFTLLPLKFALCSTSKFCLTLFYQFLNPLNLFLETSSSLSIPYQKESTGFRCFPSELVAPSAGHSEIARGSALTVKE